MGAVLQIRNMKNHRNVDIAAGRAVRHQKVHMWNRHNGWNQRWRVVNVRGNRFMLKSLKGNMYFGNRGGFWAGLQRRATWLHYDTRNHRPMRGKKCLDIWHGNMNNGANLVWWNCHGGMNQKFTMPWVSGHKVVRHVRRHHARRHHRRRFVRHYTWTTRGAVLQIRNMKNHRNVDIAAGRAVRHQKVHMWNRHNGWNQRWRVVNTRGKYFMLKSLKGNMYFGRRSGMWAGLQRRAVWLHYDARHHRLMKGHQCLDIWQANFNNGANLMWGRCHNGLNQKFVMPWVAGHKVVRHVRRHHA